MAARQVLANLCALCRGALLPEMDVDDVFSGRKGPVRLIYPRNRDLTIIGRTSLHLLHCYWSSGPQLPVPTWSNSTANTNMNLASFLQLFFGLLATVLTITGLWSKYKTTEPDGPPAT